jgi:hypothetical protein
LWCRFRAGKGRRIHGDAGADPEALGHDVLLAKEHSSQNATNLLVLRKPLDEECLLQCAMVVGRRVSSRAVRCWGSLSPVPCPLSPVRCPLGRAMALALERPVECQERCASEAGDDAGGELSGFKPREIVDEFHLQAQRRATRRARAPWRFTSRRRWSKTAVPGKPIR